jgi:LmbE family N-acetylglucosaminyl deacetylase
MATKLSIVGIGAHPDDVEIYFAGLMGLAQGAGHGIHWMIATDGGGAGKGQQATLSQRRREEACAAATLFNTLPIFLGRTDGALGDEHGVTAQIEAELRRLKPDLIITHAPNDYHPDHRALSTYVTRAASFKTPVLHADTMLGVNCQPDFYLDISNHMERKIQAIRLHASQPIDRFVERVEVWNRFRGLQSGQSDCRYAEAFSFEPRYPFGSIHTLVSMLTSARFSLLKAVWS